MLRKYSLALAAALVLSGCSIPHGPSDEKEYLGGDIHRFHDKELGVTCYIYAAPGPRGSIDCIPDHQLMPADENQGYYDEEQDVIQDKAVTRL